MREIAVKKLPRDPGPAAWNALLEPAHASAPLEEAITADVLIIGAGFAGLSAARRLSLKAPGARIVVLDATRVGEGPAGRNSGFMIDLPHDLASDDYGGQIARDRRQTWANRQAIQFALQAAADYEMPDEAIRQSGKINGAATQKGLAHNQSYADHLIALEEPFELLDAGAMKALTGIEYYQGGLFTPKAAMLQPALYVRGLAGGLTACGVSLHENAPVVSLSRSGPDWQATTPNGKVTAPRAILAVNGHLESFGFFKCQLMHVFTYASMTKALSEAEVLALGGENVWGLTPADPMGTTVRRISGIGGDRIVVRNRFTYDPSMEVSEARIKAVSRDHDRSFAARFPMLEGTEMAYRWGGRLCLSRNDVPAFGEIEQGLFAACCQNGLGTAKGTLSGMAAADLALGEMSEEAALLLEEPAPSHLPPEPIAWLGANAYIRWSEFEAGREL